ncbi:MAG: ribonuclease HII [Rhodospirillaceae bacterium]|nr:ribonuclease HII [Rhodospirillaceae bacterium]
MPDLSLEILHGAPGLPIAGIDEVGRGPLAGPVVAAAVVLPAAGLPDDLAGLIDDSKCVPAAVRAALLPRLLACCAVGIGRADVEEIDSVNILQATFLAMARALAALPLAPALALVDGNRLPKALACPAHAVVGGDGLSLSIAAASIIAKETRDAEMRALARVHPGYGWETNVGYGTVAHRAAITRLGLTPHHRRSFAPCASAEALRLPAA